MNEPVQPERPDKVIKVNVFWDGTSGQKRKPPMYTITLVGEDSYKALEMMMTDMPYILEKVIDIQSAS